MEYNSIGTKLLVKLYQRKKLLSIGAADFFAFESERGENKMINEIKRTYISSCPVCGRTLFKGTPSSCIEVGCPKCKEYLKINFTDAGYQVCVIKSDERIHFTGCAAAETKAT